MVITRSSITELTLAARVRPERWAFHMRSASPATGKMMEKQTPI